jgi:hypothetical protein
MMDKSRDEAWFSGLADALAQALVDARACSAACETLLGSGRGTLAPPQQHLLVRTLVLPAAISGGLVDLGDQPPLLVLAATRVCREASLTAVEQLALLALPLDCTAAAAALRQTADSCGRLLDAFEWA